MPTTLDPYLKMRRDGNRVIVYPGNDSQFNSSHDFAFRFVEPRAAIVISLFDGTRTKEEVVSTWAQLNETNEFTAGQFVDSVLEQYQDLMTDMAPVPERFSPVNPEKLVCNMANVDYSAERLHVPYSMLYLPTMACGHRCQYCYADIKEKRESTELTLAELEKIVDQTVELGFTDISFSGGDPFLRPDIIDIIELIFSRGYHSDVPTKSPLTEKQIQRLKDIGVTRIQISLDSPLQPDVVERLTGRKDYHARIMQTLKMLGEAGFKVGITSVIVKDTIDLIPQMTQYYGELGFIKRISFAQVAGSIYRNFDHLYPSVEKYERLVEEMDQMKRKYQHMFIKCDYLADPADMSDEERSDFFENRPVCSGGKYAFVLLPDGRVTLCEELYYNPHFIVGDLRRQSIMEMWNSHEMFNIIQPDRKDFVGSPCYECETFYECHTGKGRCWKRAVQAFADKDRCEYWPDPYCPQAPLPAKRYY